MSFRAGDMVRGSDLSTDVIELFDSPPGPLYHGEAVIAHLKRGESALVVSLDRHDGRCVYVMGPHGGGWTFGAFLQRVT